MLKFYNDEDTNQTYVVDMYDQSKEVISQEKLGILMQLYNIQQTDSTSVNRQGMITVEEGDEPKDLRSKISRINRKTKNRKIKYMKIVGHSSQITELHYIFKDVNVVFLDLSEFDTSSVTDMSYMFSDECAIKNIKFGGKFTTKNVTDMTGMFKNSSIEYLDLSSFNTSNVTNMYGMFNNFETPNLSLEGLNLSNVENMESMFTSARINNLNLGYMNSTNCKNMVNMFCKCSLNNLSGELYTSNVEDMSGMFREFNLMASTKSQVLNLSYFDTSRVSKMRSMFEGLHMWELSLDGWKLDNIDDMSYMFKLAAITSVDAGNWDYGSRVDPDDYDDEEYEPNAQYADYTFQIDENEEFFGIVMRGMFEGANIGNIHPYNLYHFYESFVDGNN